MTGPVERLRAYTSDGDRDRRLLTLLVLVLVVLLGAGFGTFAFNGGVSPDGNATTPTPPAVEVTPVTATPTPTPDPGVGQPTATDVETATRTPRDDTATPEDSRDLDRSDDDAPASGVELRVRGTTIFGQVPRLAPGESGSGSVTFENTGESAGTVEVRNVTVGDDENGLLDPEAAGGDDAVTGELSEALRVTVSISYVDGRMEYLFGSTSGGVPLASIDGENAMGGEAVAGGERATVTVEWTLPDATGNDVQSDRVVFDVEFVLRQTSG